MVAICLQLHTSYLTTLEGDILKYDTGRRYLKIENFSIAHRFNTLVFAPFVYYFDGRIYSGNFLYCLYS